MEEKVGAETTAKSDTPNHWQVRGMLVRWAIVLLAGLTVLLIPVPQGITQQSAVLSLAYFSNLDASLTHFGTSFHHEKPKITQIGMFTSDANRLRLW